MRKTKKVLALIRRGHKALKKITTLKKLEKAVIALEQLAKIKTTKKGDIKITSRAYTKKKRKTKSKTKKIKGNIYYTKNDQPYTILASGKARFLSR